MEEQRRQQEREEIERAKLEEKRRLEREALEEDQQEEGDSSDDEFESKVRTKEIRRINPNLLGQFLREPAKEPEKPHKSMKPTEERIDRASVQVSESAPVVDSHFDEIEKEREVEDEYEEKVKSKQIRKLKLDTLPFLQGQEHDAAPVPHRDVPRASRIAVQEERYVENVQRTTVESAPRKEWEEEQDEVFICRTTHAAVCNNSYKHNHSFTLSCMKTTAFITCIVFLKFWRFSNDETSKQRSTFAASTLGN